MTAPLRLPRRSKYGSVPTTVDGIRFHSKGEAGRYQELLWLQKKGEVRNLERQKAFALHVRDREIGTIVLDFWYEERWHGYGHAAWQDVAEDFKGFMTPLAKWKIAHFTAEYQQEVRLTGKRPSAKEGRTWRVTI